MTEGEAATTLGRRLVLRDEDGTEFAFLSRRLLRDGPDLFLLAEREGQGTLHVLKREGDVVELVKDAPTLRRVAVRLEILRRAMEGELIEWVGQEGGRQFLGVFQRGGVQGRPYLLAADLADPATVLAFEPSASGVEVVADEERLELIFRELEAATGGWEVAAPDRQAADLGLRQQPIDVTDVDGRQQRFRGGWRMTFEGRDLLLLEPDNDPSHVVVAQVRGPGQIEFLSDAAFVERVRAHLEELGGGTSST